MPDNEIIMSKAFAPFGDDIRERLNGLRNFRETAKQRKVSQNQNSLDADSNNLYEQSLNVNNKNLSEKYNQASQSAAAASMIKSYAEKNGDDWSDLNTPQEILTEYLTINNDDNTYNRLMDFVKSSQDPEEFGLEMGWIEKDGWDKLWDFAKNTGQNFLSFFESGGDAVRNAVNRGIGALEGDQTPGALENYAKMNYGKDFYSLSEAEKAEARNAVSNKEGLDMYKPTAQRIALKGGEAGLDALFTAFAPGIKAGFSVAGAGAEADVPVVSDVLGWALGGLDKVNGFLGGIVTEVPGLSNFRDSLQTEQEKEEFDNFLGMIVLGKVMQKRGGRIKNSRSLKETVINELDPRVTIEEFQKRFTDTPADIKEGWTNMKYGKPTQENLQDTAGLIVKPKTAEESVIATRALEKLDLEGVKDYVDLDTRFLEKNAEIQNAEDAIYKLDTRKFKPEDTSTLKIYEIEGDKYVEEGEWSVIRQGEGEPENVKYATARGIDYVQPMINLLKLFYEGNADKSATIELVEKKFNTEGLTKGEINELTKEIAKEYESYTKRGKPKETIEAQDVEAIRKKGKYFARGDDDVLIKLDRERSDNMNTQQMVKDLRDEIVRAKATTVKKNLPQKLMSALGDLLSITGVKSLLFKLIPNAVGEEKISPLTRQKNLDKYIKKFESLNERLNGAKTKKQAEIIVEEFIDEMEKDIGPIEGEVITNETNWQEYKKPNNRLEEVVQSETVYPESRMLGDNGKSSQPQDFTTMPGIDPKGNVFKGFKEVQEIDKSKK